MLSVKNNLMATNAARHLGTSYASLAKSVERLSSGLRINSAKDDAAGLAVRELVRAEVATLKQGGRNARDAISMLQTGEGAMAVIDDLLIRMKELAEQAATESYSEAQRAIMDAEFTQLGAEITRIAGSTKFNEIDLLNAVATKKIHIGSATTIDITTQKMDGATLGLTALKSVSGNNTLMADQLDDAFYTGDGTNFAFTFAGEAQIDVTLAVGGDVDSDDDWSLSEIVTAINIQSQTTSSYNAASVSYNSETKLYSLKLEAKAGGANALAIGTVLVGSSLVLANFTTTLGDAGGVSIAGADGSGAEAALTTIDLAIKTKDEYRAELGYMMNRLEAASSILDIQAENLMVAESRISDVDVATEMAAMTRTQVLAQAGISMLAQANSMPQMVLSLLG